MHVFSFCSSFADIMFTSVTRPPIMATSGTWDVNPLRQRHPLTRRTPFSIGCHEAMGRRAALGPLGFIRLQRSLTKSGEHPASNSEYEKYIPSRELKVAGKMIFLFIWTRSQEGVHIYIYI